MLLNNYNYLISILLMMIGFYSVITHMNLIKKLMGLAIFQVSVLLFYMSISNIKGGAVPILKEGITVYINPVPHVLMLTAIVVGVAVMAVGLAIAVRIKQEYGTIEEDEILKLDDELHKKELIADDSK